MFLGELFIINRSGKQPKCPSTEGWLNKTWYIYIIKYHSALNRNEVLFMLYPEPYKDEP